MPLTVVRADITKMKVDAIVNAAAPDLLGGGGVDGAIHRAAGPGLLAECRTLHGCQTGEAKVTGAYQLPAKYVIHTVGPVWHGGGDGEAELLASCYRSSLWLAEEKHCRSIAFPLISSGAFGYPREAAFRIAVDSISGFLQDHSMQVYLTVFDAASCEAARKLYPHLLSRIGDAYVAQEERVDRNWLEEWKRGR